MQQESAAILLVDDDDAIRRVVIRALEGAGYAIDGVPDRASALKALAARSYALAILDINLPDANGLDLCEELHDAYAISVVMLTVVVDESDIVRALESGADDYVRKPFGTRELVARIQSVLRRARTDDAPAAREIAAGGLRLDAAGYRARVDDEHLPLTPTEYRVLALLAQNAGRVVTHDQLLEGVWGAGYEGEHHMLHVTMSRLRQKLGRLPAGGAIRTTPGVGYEFVPGPA